MNAPPDPTPDVGDSSTHARDANYSTPTASSGPLEAFASTDPMTEFGKGVNEGDQAFSGGLEKTMDMLRVWSRSGTGVAEPVGARDAQNPWPNFHEFGYDIVGILGRGGMGVVYQAYQYRLDRVVALKTLPPAFASEPSMLQRLRNEVAILARVADTRVLEIHDVFEAGGVPVLVMPYIDGPDLGKIIENRRKARKEHVRGSRSSRILPGDREYYEGMLPILEQLVAAVSALHKAGVIHRDIKPSNVLVDLRGNVRLSDFGLARVGVGAGFTQAGAAIGTRGFMSPEQWEGSATVDSRTDVFGLGVTLYEALTLELPFGRERVSQTTPPPKPPSHHLGLLTTDDDAIILKALEPNANDRFASATELLEEWSRVRSGLGTRIRRIGLFRRLERWTRRHPWTAANIGILILALAVAGIVWNMIPVRIFDDQNRRLVTVQTNPPGARFVAVELDQFTGEPQTRSSARAATTPAEVRLKPGDYLVVVEWSDRRFHEVFRHVPQQGEHPGNWRHRSWDGQDGSKITLPTIVAPPWTVLDDMVLIQGTSRFSPLADPLSKLKFRTEPIPDYYLDSNEVTNAAYLRFWRALPVRIPGDPVDEDGERDHAVRTVEFNRAVYVAEEMGKRLPEDLEYLYAATNGGTTKYPWGDDEPDSWEEVCAFSPVRAFARDRTRSDRPVFGLFSNVAEWTSTRPNANLADLDPYLKEFNATQRVVRGGFISAGKGSVPSAERILGGPSVRYSMPQENTFEPGLGFRGARSARPRFLDSP